MRAPHGAGLAGVAGSTLLKKQKPDAKFTLHQQRGLPGSSLPPGRQASRGKRTGASSSAYQWVRHVSLWLSAARLQMLGLHSVEKKKAVVMDGLA